VGNGVDEAVVLFVATNLPHQEAGVEDESSGDRPEEDDSKDDLEVLAPVKDDPAKAYRDGHGSQDYAERKEENLRVSTASYLHMWILARLAQFLRSSDVGRTLLPAGK